MELKDALSLRRLNWHAWEMQRRQRIGLLVKDNEDFQKKCKLKIVKTPLEAKAKSKPTKLPRKPIITCFQVGSPEMGMAAKKVTFANKGKGKGRKGGKGKGKTSQRENSKAQAELFLLGLTVLVPRSILPSLLKHRLFELVSVGCLTGQL